MFSYKQADNRTFLEDKLNPDEIDLILSNKNNANVQSIIWNHTEYNNIGTFTQSKSWTNGETKRLYMGMLLSIKRKNEIDWELVAESSHFHYQ